MSGQTIDFLDLFLLGVLVTACGAVGLHFLRFWRRSGDSLFLMFAIAFWLFGANWGAQAVLHESTEAYPEIYLLRLLGFGFIIFGIVRKNLAAGRSGRV